jgi:hypothetical protein
MGAILTLTRPPTVPARSTRDREPRFHCRSDAQGFMNAAKIVRSEPERNRCPVVLPLLGERIGQPRETANAHSQTEVTALDNRCTNPGRIGSAHDWDLLPVEAKRRLHYNVVHEERSL